MGYRDTLLEYSRDLWDSVSLSNYFEDSDEPEVIEDDLEEVHYELEDGVGCTEIWEKMEDRRNSDD